jgi:hypothetical protein
MPNIKTPLLGWAFNDVLNELHQLVFHGVPGESEPFEIVLLEREYIAYVLACYYQCGRCLSFHEHAINVIHRKENSAEWNWKEQIVQATLFLHLDGRKLSDMEWQHWLRLWSDFAKNIDTTHPGLAAYLAYAIGIARHDIKLMDVAFSSISEAVTDNKKLMRIIREIDGVVIFMKAATSKNRSDPSIINHLKARGIEGA